MLRRSARQVAYQPTRLTSMPKQDMRSSVPRKINFAIQLLREAAELLEVARPRLPHSARATRDAFQSATSSTAQCRQFRLPALALFRGGRPGVTPRQYQHRSHAASLTMRDRIRSRIQ